MKAGQAAKWSTRVFRWEEQLENVGYHKFVDWEDFQDKFKREFCPVYADSAAINWLESTAYFQKSRSMDEYLNEFQDLISNLHPPMCPSGLQAVRAFSTQTSSESVQIDLD